MKLPFNSSATVPASGARGFTTLLMAILLLGILSIVVIFGTSVGVFDQRTAVNEHRAKLAQASAEAGVGLAAEFMKASFANLNSEEAGGWLNPASRRWVPCSTAAPSGQVDPCLSERDANRRNNMYRYVANNTTRIDLGSMMPAAALPTAVSLGNADTALVVSVSATLCRLDMTDPGNPFCSLDPQDDENRVAVTLVSNAAIAGEDARAEAKETLSSYRMIGGAATVPLVASGTMKGLGAGEVVANPNAGGFGVPVSIWSPCEIGVAGGATAPLQPNCDVVPNNGIGAFSTCHLGEFLQGRPRTELHTACLKPGNSCGCPTSQSLSAGGNVKIKNYDILDPVANAQRPGATYFPRAPWDNPNDPLDDSMFEVIFGVDVVDQGQINVRQGCEGPTEFGGDCAKIALHDLGAQRITNCDTLGPASSGLIWMTGTGCRIKDNIGSPGAPVVLVVEDEVRINGAGNFFGLLFVRSSTESAGLKGTGNFRIFGMAVVEGDVDVAGGFSIVYDDAVAQAINNSPDFMRFGRVPGSWLDARSGF